jgi:ribosomal protein S18 acetylase RimI-like enzyme
VFTIRPFRNNDVAGIVSAWNRLMTGPNIAQPISNNEFEIFVLSKPYFDATGLLVAVDDDSGRIAGFTHCGFGPADPDRFCRQLDQSLGTIAIVCSAGNAAMDDALIQAGIKYLREKGADVIYGGGRFPLTPFYWGLYGGSEFSGVLESQPEVQAAMMRNGLKESARSVLFEFNLAKAEPRHIKNIVLKRESQLMILDDDLPGGAWLALAIEAFHPIRVELQDRSGRQKVASSALWPMALFGRREGCSRIGLIDVEVDQAYRRRGFGRLLVTESIKCAMEQSYDILAVQTDATNSAAIKLYESMGFVRTETASLYRLE